jgi:two-component system phosphate regulon sensor histidine kinase PhoR
VQEFKLAKTTINNLVTFAAFLSKQGQLQLMAVDVSKLACQAAAELEPMAQARDVTLTLELPPEMPPEMPAVYGDRERLTEAIYHLVHNAIKFNRPGGAVIISCRSTPGNIIVEVADTGVGIPPERLPDIWNGFAQWGDPLRRGVEGLGLGLALVRYVVEAHGGEVWAESTPGQGSLFGFCLPLAEGTSAA